MQNQKSNRLLADGIYKIQVENSKVFQYEGGSVVISEWTGQDNQLWEFYYVSNWQAVDGYCIRPVGTTKYLAWDRNKGNILTVREHDRDIEYTKYWKIYELNNRYIIENHHYPFPYLNVNGDIVNVSQGQRYEFTLVKDPDIPNPNFNDISLVITSDPQYPWTPKMDDGDNSESDSETRSVSERLIREQYQDINSYTNSVPNSSVLINGDITAFGHGWQRDKMKNLLSTLNKKYYYGLGNHDIENNKNDCAMDECFRASMQDYQIHVDGHKLPKSQVDFEKKEYMTVLWYEGSFYYTVDFGGIYSIQLNNFPTMTASCGMNGYGKPGYTMEPNLDWLEQKLKFASQSGKIIIVNVHKPDDWKGGPNERFKKLLKDYDVAAVFCGHYHKQCGRKYQYSDYFGDVPVFLSGSASQRTYLILELSIYRKEINIYSVRDNNWKNKKLEQRIEINSLINGKYQIATALNDKSVLDLNGPNHVTLWENNGGSHQRWNFVYDKKKEAYQIYSVSDKNLVLAWNAIPNSRQVFATPNQYKEEHYWLLEATGDGYYIIKNKKEPTLVLDVTDSETANGTKIKVHPQH
ncbi:RICIN domain-containing protein, partial [Paenibacillus larvae]